MAIYGDKRPLIFLCENLEEPFIRHFLLFACGEPGRMGKHRGRSSACFRWKQRQHSAAATIGGGIGKTRRPASRLAMDLAPEGRPRRESRPIDRLIERL